MYKFTINGKLPNLNEYLKAERQTFRNKGKFTTKGNELKQTNQNRVIWILRQQLRGIHINKPIYIRYRFYEPNMKRDLDNISAFAHKIIQDALVKGEIIDNDGWKNITGFSDSFYVDKKNPRIEVELIEEGE